MENVVCIGNQELEIKEWNGQRVITLADIDNVHRRPYGTAKKNFFRRKDKFIRNEDYFTVKPSDILKHPKGTLGVKKFRTEVSL